MDTVSRRAAVLAAYGAGPAEQAELLAYNANTFDHQSTALPRAFPLPPEPHLAAWTAYAAEAAQIGVYPALQQRLVQLQFPVQAGISATPAYQAATRKGVPVAGRAAAPGLALRQPDRLQLVLHPSLAGPVPVLIAPDRGDFIALVQALARRNEPLPVPESMGACIVGGLTNWDRVATLRRAWEAAAPPGSAAGGWDAEFARLIPQKALYQDRLILLSVGPYSGVPAADLGLDGDTWQRLSGVIRLEHECTHYFTRRVFGAMHNNLLDELIADYMGLTAALGSYCAAWFLHFVGLEGPAYREGGRLQNYRGTPPLSAGAFAILGALVRAAAATLERWRPPAPTAAGRAQQLIALTYLTLEELAAPSGVAQLDQMLRETQLIIHEAHEAHEADEKIRGVEDTRS